MARLPRVEGRYLIVTALLLTAIGAVWTVQRSPASLPPAVDALSYAMVTDIDTWQQTRRQQWVRTPYDLRPDADWTSLPLQIDGWSGEDVHDVDPAVFEVLQPDAYLSRYYRRGDGRYLWLSLLSSRRGASFHPPQICYGGWHTVVRSEPVPLVQGELYAMSLLASREQDVQLVYHFYLWPGPARKLEDGLVMFKVTAPLQGTESETRDMVRAFIAAWFEAAAVDRV
jgi:hypothetical protein